MCRRGFRERRDAAIIAVLKATRIRLSQLAQIRYDPDDPVGLDYWITPGQASRPGSSLSDHFARLPARSLPAGLPGSAVPGTGAQGR
jgi:hypothetical protein